MVMMARISGVGSMPRNNVSCKPPSAAVGVESTLVLLLLFSSTSDAGDNGDDDDAADGDARSSSVLAKSLVMHRCDGWCIIIVSLRLPLLRGDE